MSLTQQWCGQDIEGAEGLPNHTAPALTQFLTELRTEGEKTNPTFQISFCSPIYMGQPICAHANDWAGMIKPKGVRRKTFVADG